MVFKKTKQNKNKTKKPNKQANNNNYIAETIIYALSSLSAKQENKTHGKAKWKKTTTNVGVEMLMPKRHIRTRSSDQHRLLLLNKVKIRNIAIQSARENTTCTKISK